MRTEKISPEDAKERFLTVSEDPDPHLLYLKDMEQACLGLVEARRVDFAGTKNNLARAESRMALVKAKKECFDASQAYTEYSAQVEAQTIITDRRWEGIEIHLADNIISLLASLKRVSPIESKDSEARTIPVPLGFQVNLMLAIDIMLDTEVSKSEKIVATQKVVDTVANDISAWLDEPKGKDLQSFLCTIGQ